MRLAFLCVALACISRAVYAQGNPVGPEFHVNTFTTDLQRYPAVASDGSGNFVVVWQSFGQDGSNYGVFGQRYSSSGAPLGPEFRVNTYTTGSQARAAVAADAVGNFVVVWDSFQQDGSSYGVFGQRYSSSGVPLGPEFRVNTHTTSHQREASVAVDASGNFVVVWASVYQGFAVFGQRYDSSGTPQGPEFHVDTVDFGVTYPDVAADGAGNFVVVWNSPDASSDGIFGQRFASSGVPLAPPFQVNTTQPYYQRRPSVAEDASGDFVVVWHSLSQNNELGVFGQRFSSSGVPLGPEFEVPTFTIDNQRAPSVACDASGNFVVVWMSLLEDGSSYGIYGQRYAATGAPLGGEFRVNTFTTNAEVFPEVASDPAGHFVVVWESQVQETGGFNPGIFGQRYGQIVPVELIHFGVE